MDQMAATYRKILASESPCGLQPESRLHQAVKMASVRIGSLAILIAYR